MSQALETASARPQSLIIKGLCPGLTERGKIKIGEKGRMITSAKGNQFQPPQKLDYFKVTSLFRGPDGNYQLDSEVHGKYGDKPRILPIRLLYDEIDLNFQCRYACFNGKTMWCAGDGETGLRLHESGSGRVPVPCPCGRQEPTYTGVDRCKINGTLGVIIDGINSVGGVWKFRTTSYNSVVGILSSLALIKRITGGPLAGLPLHLTLNPKTVITPTDGKSMNVWVVGVEYRGSVEDLQKIGYEKAKHDAVHYARIEAIETEARRIIARDPVHIDDEDPQEIIEEFYPEQVKPEQVKPINGTASASQSTPSAANQSLDSEYVAPPETQEAVQPEQQQQPDQHQQPEEKKIRRRTRKFEVDPEIFGVSEIQTCGATPAQLSELRQLSKDPSRRQFISQWLQESTGYNELSYLTLDEADRIIALVNPSKEAAESNDTEELPQQPDSAPQNERTVLCPLTGDSVYESFCRSTCATRATEGFCPVIDEIPGGGLI